MSLTFLLAWMIVALSIAVLLMVIIILRMYERDRENVKKKDLGDILDDRLKNYGKESGRVIKGNGANGAIGKGLRRERE
jgi:hypothetical protein